MKVFVSATNVETGRVKVFKREELTADMVLASTCLPFMYQAVEVDGVPYWDGGYMGNPALFPFYNACTSPDIVIVQINPVTRSGAPRPPLRPKWPGWLIFHSTSTWPSGKHGTAWCKSGRRRRSG